MSHYLSIYIETDAGEKKELFALSSANELYELFRENGASYAIDGQGEMHYSKITQKTLSDIESELRNRIQKNNSLLETLKEYPEKAKEYTVDEILYIKDENFELTKLIGVIYVLQIIIDDAEFYSNGIQGLLVNYD